jgi:DNA invertase Pin-like site-specific DNA recombinase
MRVAGRARKSGSNLQLCLTTPRSGSSIAFCSGRWIGSAERAMTQTIIHLQRLSSNGVAFHSYTEPHLATDNELVRNVLLALLSSLAKVEAQKISERTTAGMSRARAKGVKIGRPKLAAELRHEITRRAAKGETAYAIAKALHIDRHTAAKYLQS